MNFRKLFGSKPSQSAGSAAMEEARRALEGLPRAREHHYHFAHRFFPALVRQMGAATLFILANPDKAQPFLSAVWADVGQELPPDDRITTPPRLARIGPANLNGEAHLIAVIEMPPAQAVTEAHFVALTCASPEQPGDGEERDAFEERLRAVAVRYLTLEYGFSLDATQRTAFCEWTQDGSHLNRGDGPPPAADALWSFLTSGDEPGPHASFSPGSPPQSHQ